MLSLQEISDRMEIQDLISYYSRLIDTKQLDELRNVFTEDAYVDYSVYGGDEAKGSLTEIIPYLKKALPAFPNTQHLNANIEINILGDSATGRVMCFNPMEVQRKEGGRQTFLLGLYYHDKYLRTADGWRIQERIEESCWQLSTPDFLNMPE